jgi:hypothetical protein
MSDAPAFSIFLGSSSLHQGIKRAHQNLAESSLSVLQSIRALQAKSSSRHTHALGTVIASRRDVTSLIVCKRVKASLFPVTARP